MFGFYTVENTVMNSHAALPFIGGKYADNCDMAICFLGFIAARRMTFDAENGRIHRRWHFGRGGVKLEALA